MNKTEKTAFRESVIVVMMGMVINFPLQTFLLKKLPLEKVLWLTIDNWSWTNTLLISIFTQTILTLVALIRVYSIRMRFTRGKF
jgi:hypothetical protein